MRGRAGDADDCDKWQAKKISKLDFRFQLAQLCKWNACACWKVCVIKSGVESLFWEGESRGEGVFCALDVSPFVKLHQHIRIGALYVSSGEPIVFAQPTEENRVVSFLRPGIFPVNDQSFFLIADQCLSLCLISV